MEPRALLNAGDPDTAFSGDGITTVSFGGTPLLISDTSLLPDGKVLVAGSRIVSNHYQAAIARLNGDGSVDTAFGANGLFSTTNFAIFESMDVGSDGKPVLTTGPQGNDVGDPTDLRIVRLNADGSGFDNTFGGGDGIADVGNKWYRSNLNKVVVQRDGKILATGNITDSDTSDSDVVIVRYDADGSTDDTFDGDGIVIRGLGGYDTATAIAVDYTGNSDTNPYYGYINVAALRDGQSRFYAVRLRPNGTADTTFDGDGVYAVPPIAGPREQVAQAVVAMPGGKMLIGGYSSPSGSSGAASRDFILARVNPNATLDATFNGTGAVIKDVGGGRDEVLDLDIGYAGNVLAAGISNGKFAILAYNADGTLDTRFSGDGILVTPFVFNDNVPSVAIDVTLDLIAPIRRVVIAGENGTVGRYVDVGSVITVSSSDPYASEPGGDTATVTVSRSKAIDKLERVYFGYTGTAGRQGTLPVNPNYDFTATNISWGNGTSSFTFVDIPANQSSVTLTITARDDALSEGDEQGTLTVVPNVAYDVGTPGSATFVIRDNEAAGPPVVSSAAFRYETAPQRATITFNQNVQASLGYADFVVTGPGGSSPNYSLSYDNVTNTQTLNFTDLLPDGNYTVRAIGSGIRNGVNQAMASDYTLSFFVLAGDFNRNRAVGFDDLLTLAKNYNAVGKTFSGGNADYSADGLVSFADLLILAKNYNKTLAAATSATASPESASTPTRRRSAFGVSLLT